MFTMFIRLTILSFLFFFSLYSYSQPDNLRGDTSGKKSMRNDTPIKKSNNTYCYYPADPQRVARNGTISFYVSSFTAKEVGNIDLLIQEDGKLGPEIGGISFTIDAPYETGTPIKHAWISNNSVRINLSGYMAGKNYISVYLNRVASATGIEYAGPITFVSSNENMNPGFMTQCETEHIMKSEDNPDIIKGSGYKATRSNPDTGAKWVFKAPRQITIKMGGPKTDVLNNALLNAKIIPTKGMLSMIDRINPGLGGLEELEQGRSVVLPVFQKANAAELKSMDLQIQKDTSKDEVQNALFLEKSKSFDAILRIIRKLVVGDEFMSPLDNIDILLRKTAKNRIKLKKIHADRLNSEIDKLNNYLLKITADGSFEKINDKYINSFYTYIFEIINPYFIYKNPTGLNVRKTYTSGLMSKEKEFLGVDPEDFYDADPDIETAIYIFQQVMQDDGAVTMVEQKDKYSVYCLSEFQYMYLNDEMGNLDEDYRNSLDLITLNKLITLADLDKELAKCYKPASMTSTMINPEGKYHFIVVTTDPDKKNKIVIHDFKDVSKTPPHTENIPRLYGIGLYLEPTKANK